MTAVEGRGAEMVDQVGGFWQRVGAGVAVAGRVTGRGAARLGRALSRAYHSVDPDARRHLGQLPLVGLSMLSRRAAPLEAAPDDGHRPLLCVHGLGGHRGNFLALRLFLRAQGRRRVYALGFERVDDLRAMAAELRVRTQEALRVNGLDVERDRVDWVAHSMGGVVARLALEDEETARRVATLVTLGTPHRGSYLARYTAAEPTASLRRDSTLMAELEAQLPWPGPPGRPRLVTFWSEADLIVVPPEAARVDGVEQVELAGMTHYDYLLQPACFALVLEALEGPGPR